MDGCKDAAHLHRWYEIPPIDMNRTTINVDDGPVHCPTFYTAELHEGLGRIVVTINPKIPYNSQKKVLILISVWKTI